MPQDTEVSIKYYDPDWCVYNMSTVDIVSIEDGKVVLETFE